jgi:hypothetical protein
VNGEIGGGGAGGSGTAVCAGLDIGSGPTGRGDIERGVLEASAAADTGPAAEDGVSAT